MHYIPAKSASRILDLAARRGVAAAVACAAADIEPAMLRDPDYRLSFARVVRLSDACARLSGDASFGLHLGESAPAGTFDVVEFITLRSNTVSDALRQLERYQRLRTDGVAVRTIVDGRQARIEYRYDIDDPGTEGRRQDCEAMLAVVTMVVRALLSSTWQPQIVWCEHAPPADTSEHSRIFRCPIEFGQLSNALVVDPAVLSCAVAPAESALMAALNRHAQSALKARPSTGDLSDRVRDVLVLALRGGDPDLAQIATELGMSTRTLQRRLQDEGTSLHDVIDELRRDLSARYFEQPELTIADVAYLLGFSEPATFHRAFRRWTGLTAGEVRRRMPMRQ